MTKDDAKRAILAEWLALPPEHRREDRQAAEFAMRIKDRFAFRASGDRYQVIKGWLLNNLARG